MESRIRRRKGRKSREELVEKELIEKNKKIY